MDVKRTRMTLWMWGSTLKFIENARREQQAFLLWANDAADTLKAQRITDMPRGGQAPDMLDVIEHMQHRIEMYREAEKDVENRIEQRLNLKRKLDAIIDDLPPIQNEVIHMRYQEGRQWEYIALKMNYDERSVRRFDRRAVETIAKKYMRF